MLECLAPMLDDVCLTFLILINHFFQHFNNVKSFSRPSNNVTCQRPIIFKHPVPNPIHRLFKMVEQETPSKQGTGKNRRRTWKNENMKTLIECYEQRPCLWNTFDKDYHNKDRKQLVLSEIEEILGDIPKEELQAKWNMLRGQYSREFHLVSKKKSGAGVDEQYKSKWQFFQQLKFLELVVEARKSTNTFTWQKVDEEHTCEGADFCLFVFCSKHFTEGAYKLKHSPFESEICHFEEERIVLAYYKP